MNHFRLRAVLLAAASLSIGVPATAQSASKPPKPSTLKANADMACTLPFADRRDFDDTARGFIGTLPHATVLGTGHDRSGR